MATLRKRSNLFLDEEGLWRCGGRLENADVPFHTKHPILVPRNHHLATLIVRQAHTRVLHNGVKDTLNEVRSRFWLVKGRPGFCQEDRPSVYHLQEVRRQTVSQPNTSSSTKVQTARGSSIHLYRGRLCRPTGVATASNKVWICLHNCCVTRAIHLEIVPDLTTAAFIRCLKRFSSRRGLPQRFVSDNGKTFKAAAKAINKILCDKTVHQYLSGVGVEWLFNLERAPWWGGVFEHMVRMTKRCLRKMVGRAKLTFDELNTIVIEVEGVINSRPLTYISPEDLEQPLTPAHLLSGRRLLSLPDAIYCKDAEDDFEVTSKHLTKRLLYLNRILNNFWKRRQTEYLSELREAHVTRPLPRMW